MNDLRFEKFKIKGADLGEPNYLPSMRNDTFVHSKINISETVPPEDRQYVNKGMISTLLPYCMQSRYNRERKDQEFDAVILENDYLKATFVTQLGGRLWSLYDKKSNRELLYSNDVFQLGNLALRNAWFAGGVEWNLGIRGHNPLTCSPMFAQRVDDENGNPMLRMYEFERIREVAYSIVAKLEKDVLLVNVTIENNDDKDKYMYWWSNIAVEETKNTRVIVPAHQSFCCTYNEGVNLLDLVNIPEFEGIDISYASNMKIAKDFFFKIPNEEKKWIAAINEDGYGLVQMSTQELAGRKLFLWGQSNGGDRWNRRLSDSGKRYIEIQAGLLKTQFEHFVMKANSKISWTEGYSAISVDKKKAHAKDYDAAINEVKKHICSKKGVVEDGKFNIKCEEKITYLGSGWGNLQERLTGKKVSSIVEFPSESVNEETLEWGELLEKGELSEHDAHMPVTSYVKGDKWIKKLNNTQDNWYKYYHLAVICYEKEDIQNAYEYFLKSASLTPNAWAFRGLSQIEKDKYNNLKKAAEYIQKAVELKNDYQPLWVEYAEIMNDFKNYDAWISSYEKLSCELKENCRLKILYASSLVGIGNVEKARDIILKDDFELSDIREGELSISHLWLEIHRAIMGKSKDEVSDSDVYKAYPLPERLDFRMS